MKTALLSLLLTSLLALLISLTALAGSPDCLTKDEAELGRLINQYRISLGLKAIPISNSLTQVARFHVEDLNLNHPDKGLCNMHSWSATRPEIWQPVCYTDDHKQAELMWSKPAEISDGAYNSPGFEIAFWYSETVTPKFALENWIESPPHHAVIAQHEPWTKATFRAMGVGIEENFSVVWFGEMTDPEGTLEECPQ